MADETSRKVRMPLAVRAARTLRHSTVMRHADWLWNAMRPIYRRALALTGGRLGIAVDVDGLGTIRLPASYLQEDIPAGELPTLSELLKKLRVDSVFYDVGASVGMYSFFALNRLGPAGEIHAFEPDENSCRTLLSHLAAVEPACAIRVNRAFLSDTTNGDANSIQFRSGSIPASSGTRHLYLFENQDAALAHQCRLDDYVRAGHRAPDVVKCDIEGAELLFLRGSEAVLREFGPTILLSVHPELLARFGHSVDAIRSLLGDLGYRICQLNDDGELHWICSPASV